VAVEETAWLTAWPPAVIDAELVTLRRMRVEDTEALVASVNESLEHLRPWMPFAQQAATTESMSAFLRSSEERWDQGLDFGYLLHDRDRVVGACGLHCRLGPGALAIGYWVHVDYIGRGLATSAARVLTHAAFSLPGVDRVEIHCDARNHRSAAVAARVGYRLLRVEPREPEAPGDSGERMVWATERNG
jgi:RimJ/RimL family protein N-acetyltransferase